MQEGDHLQQCSQLALLVAARLALVDLIQVELDEAFRIDPQILQQPLAHRRPRQHWKLPAEHHPIAQGLGVLAQRQMVIREPPQAVADPAGRIQCHGGDLRNPLQDQTMQRQERPGKSHAAAAAAPLPGSIRSPCRWAPIATQHLIQHLARQWQRANAP